MSTKQSKTSEVSTTESPSSYPFHFAIHKPGYHFESCCGICNLYPGVLLIAIAQFFGGGVLLSVLLTGSYEYDSLYRTSENQLMSTVTGALLCGIIGAGFLLFCVAVTENCRAMLVYLFVAVLLNLGIVALGLAKIYISCGRFHLVRKVRDEDYTFSNLACVTSLFTMFGAVLYFFSLMVVFSFYHFRYVRRAIWLHEAECQ